jgi:predicted DNA-binding antitoxin AbrB/MazE fold protein
MYVSTEAVYENGVLRPVTPLTGLSNGQQLTVVLYDEEELRKREKEFIQQMKAEGRMVELPQTVTTPPKKFEPIKIQGQPLSETILEDRR